MDKQILVFLCVEKVLLRKGKDIIEVATLVCRAKIWPREFVVWKPGEGNDRGVSVALQGEAD
jgi:hypothetical protein